ncbi:MAG: gliding motility lipoprotein GldH [Bacteroidota bacterium]
MKHKTFFNIFFNVSSFLKSMGIILLFFFSSCDTNRVFEDNIELPKYIWDMKNKISFEVNIDDTISYHNLYINVRNASHYPYANLFIFVSIKFPNGIIAKDTVNCILADENGQWKGDGLGDIWDNQIPWKQKIKFPVKGKYIFEYEQAMRHEQIPFIMDVGLRVEKIK